MASSFLVGHSKVVEATEPRFLILSGNEHYLRTKIIDTIQHRDNSEYIDVYEKKAFLFEIFSPARRAGRDKIVVLRNVGCIDSWDWLPVWFNTVKNVRIVVTDVPDKLAEKLAYTANSRGLHIDCSAPQTQTGQSKFVKCVGEWYGHSLTQLNLLFNHNYWKISECLQVLDKLAILNLPLTSDILLSIGVSHQAHDEFYRFLIEDKASLAMTTIPRIQESEYLEIIHRLSTWLDKLARVKCTQSYMKPMHEIAREVGESISDTELLQKQGRKFDMSRINRLALALASADRDISAGYRSGLLEVLTIKW